MKTIAFTIQVSDGQKTISQITAGGNPDITDKKYVIRLDGDDPEILYKLIVNVCLVYGKITNLDSEQIKLQIKEYLNN